MWRLDGKHQELFYLSAERRLMAVPFTEAGPGLPLSLFEVGPVNAGRAAQSYAPSRDGQRFLILTPVEESAAATIVFNWSEALKPPR